MEIILGKVNKTIELLCKLQNVLPRSALLTIYKSFITPHLDYGDIVYVQAYNSSFHQKIELLQYNACLAITGATKRTSREKLYDKLGLESLQLRRWFRKLSCFYKLFNSEHPHYLFNIIPSRNSSMLLEIYIIFLFLKTRHTFLKKLFLSTIIEWNKLDHNIRNSSSFNNFRNILKFIRPSTNSLFNYHNPKGIKFIARLWLGLSHERKFKHSFKIL